MDVIGVLIHSATARMVHHVEGSARKKGRTVDHPGDLGAYWLRAHADLVRCVLGACAYRAQLALRFCLRSVGLLKRYGPFLLGARRASRLAVIAAIGVLARRARPRT